MNDGEEEKYLSLERSLANMRNVEKGGLLKAIQDVKYIRKDDAANLA